MVKELALLKIVVTNEFVVRGTIAKLPPSWRDFTTALCDIPPISKDA
jgi:hypothetical protein